MRGNILLTGGAGFIGRAIMSKAKRESWDARFTVYSRDEQKQDECRRKFPDAAYVLGDVRDIDRLTTLAANQDSIIHTAALKYIPEAEFNVNECIGINVTGTQAVIYAAMHSRVERVVLISTDKAVEPLNTYGLSKALAERLIFEASRMLGYDKRFTAVRYGNVIGSTGSIVPVFKRMAAEGKTITITDPAMTRFWISANDAVELIISAWDMGVRNGGILIPNPKAMAIGALVEAICPGHPTTVVGMRPGEKKHEKLMGVAEAVKAYEYNDDVINKAWVYHGENDPSGPEFELNSLNATQMLPDEFVLHAEQAAQI